MIAGRYVLHLYCEDCAAFGEFVSPGFTDGLTHAMREARRKGWTRNADRSKAWCPKHNPHAPTSTDIAA